MKKLLGSRRHVSRGRKGRRRGKEGRDREQAGRHPFRAHVIIQIKVGELLRCGVQADCGALVLCLATLKQSPTTKQDHFQSCKRHIEGLQSGRWKVAWEGGTHRRQLTQSVSWNVRSMSLVAHVRPAVANHIRPTGHGEKHRSYPQTKQERNCYLCRL